MGLTDTDFESKNRTEAEVLDSFSNVAKRSIVTSRLEMKIFPVLRSKTVRIPCSLKNGYPIKTFLGKFLSM